MTAPGRGAGGVRRHRAAHRSCSRTVGGDRRGVGGDVRPAALRRPRRHLRAAGLGGPRRLRPHEGGDLLGRFARYSLADMVRGLDEYFPGEAYLPAPPLPRGAPARAGPGHRRGARQARGDVPAHLGGEAASSCSTCARPTRPSPRRWPSWPATSSSRRRWPSWPAWTAAAPCPSAPSRWCGGARRWGSRSTSRRPEPALRRAVLAALDAVAAEPAPDRITTVGRLVEDAGALGLDFGLWDVQNRFFEIWRDAGGRPPDARPAGSDARLQSRSGGRLMRVPLATYRLQLGRDLTFDDAAARLPYLERLGVSDCYTSPFFETSSTQQPRLRRERSHPPARGAGRRAGLRPLRGGAARPRAWGC